MKSIVLLISFALSFGSVLAQYPTAIDVAPGNGNGLKFWAPLDDYKIHMGNTSEYQYGPVTDYSIKTNMNTTVPGRGWTWGTSGVTPVAAISTLGHMQIAGNLKIGGSMVVELSNDIQFGVGITKEPSAGRIAYQRWSDGLDIVGAGTTSNNRKIKFFNEGGASFNGKVGIGTGSPDHLLTVNGTIHAKEVIVDTSIPTPDYVFENDYKLPSLEEVRRYIVENKHLPEVPSAKDMEASGVNLVQMNMLLLKKVEEMTLYMIEQNSRLKNLELENVSCKDQIAELAKKLK